MKKHISLVTLAAPDRDVRDTGMGAVDGYIEGLR